jgi:cAMP-binding proteins - catabolite gene activator and regulatory subunit of cAMP-dependent protein kinases
LSLDKVQLFKNTSDGKLAEKQTINSMQVFGVWNSILGNNARAFTAKALEKSSALIIPKPTLDKKLSTLDPFIRLLFRQALSNSENFGSM